MFQVGETGRQMQGAVAYQSRDSREETTVRVGAGSKNQNCECCSLIVDKSES